MSFETHLSWVEIGVSGIVFVVAWKAAAKQVVDLLKAWFTASGFLNPVVAFLDFYLLHYLKVDIQDEKSLFADYYNLVLIDQVAVKNFVLNLQVLLTSFNVDCFDSCKLVPFTISLV